MFRFLLASVLVSLAASQCVDQVNPSTGRSECAARASLCNNPTYFALMTQQCPRTCGRCSSVVTSTTRRITTASSTCVDKVNPSTGRSDCTANANLCNNPVYLSLMTQQCPRTCGRCSG
ncbi:unnamed protein product [Caenorhabditis auriculariae]|uniref:ShKT domain-containing protein n=1 Tax=Caenorhabditis auriculariae TaxID=2777116 RepID=A0A8S1H2R1_9PELO|nr:unnamed protein product [Caenorhabditis auriculariae]